MEAFYESLYSLESFCELQFRNLVKLSNTYPVSDNQASELLNTWKFEKALKGFCKSKLLQKSSKFSRENLKLLQKARRFLKKA